VTRSRRSFTIRLSRIRTTSIGPRSPWTRRKRRSAPESPRFSGGLPFPFSTDNRFESLTFFFHVQSLCLLAGGGLLLWAAGIGDGRRRQTVAIAALLTVAAAAYIIPFQPSLLRMADSTMYTRNRRNFETALKEINFENHLTGALLTKIYPAFGPGEDAPERTFSTLPTSPPPGSSSARSRSGSSSDGRHRSCDTWRSPCWRHQP
jgi:hypothetical protein